MNQRTLATTADQGTGFERYRKPTWRDEILETMNAIVSWAVLCELIQQHYAKVTGTPSRSLHHVRGRSHGGH